MPLGADTKVSECVNVYLFDIRFDECELLPHAIKVFRRQEADVRRNVIKRVRARRGQHVENNTSAGSNLEIRRMH